MTDRLTDNALEQARTRLESAMSRLAQGAASAREARQQAIHMAAEKAALEGRVTALEQENLKLHEQVATLSLTPEPPANDGALAALREEKEALEGNYSLLKRQYAALQDEAEALRDGAAEGATATGSDGEMESRLRGENAELKKAIMVLKAERDDIRAELDGSIAKLETLLEDA
jgi:chromosome segregation ATPase